MKQDIDHITDSFCEDWATHLDRDDRVSLGLFSWLYFQLTKLLNMGELKAAEFTGMKSERTVCEWRSYFLENGEIPECKQGKYQRTSVLWTSEEVNKKAGDYFRSNANVKGKPNLTVAQFCHWVNNDLLPNETLEPGFPRKVVVKTARRWMHEIGFEVITKKKVTFVDVLGVPQLQRCSIEGS